MGQIEWAMWANEQAIAGAVSKFSSSTLELFPNLFSYFNTPEYTVCFFQPCWSAVSLGSLDSLRTGSLLQRACILSMRATLWVVFDLHQSGLIWSNPCHREGSIQVDQNVFWNPGCHRSISKIERQLCDAFMPNCNSNTQPFDDCLPNVWRREWTVVVSSSCAGAHGSMANVKGWRWTSKNLPFNFLCLSNVLSRTNRNSLSVVFIFPSWINSPVSLLILFFEWPRSKRQKGNTIERRWELFVVPTLSGNEYSWPIDFSSLDVQISEVYHACGEQTGTSDEELLHSIRRSCHASRVHLTFWELHPRNLVVTKIPLKDSAFCLWHMTKFSSIQSLDLSVSLTEAQFCSSLSGMSSTMCFLTTKRPEVHYFHSQASSLCCRSC